MTGLGIAAGVWSVSPPAPWGSTLGQRPWGSTLDVADEQLNDAAFGRPGASRGASAYPQIRFGSLVENGTHVLFASRMDGYGTSDIALARSVVEDLQNGMLCLADRQFFSFAQFFSLRMWGKARESGADLLWRIKKNARLPRETVFADGSYLSRIYPSERDRRHEKGRRDGARRRLSSRRRRRRPADLPPGDHHPRSQASIPGLDPRPRSQASIPGLDPRRAPALDLAALYHERWAIETAFDELKTHLRGARIVLL